MEVDAWRCLLYGDLYELAPKDYMDTDPSTSPAPDSLKDIKAPPGFKYRRLNPEGFEVTVDVFDLAGRCYPDLMASGWFSEYPQPGKAVAGENTKAIAGLRAESVEPPADCAWKGEHSPGCGLADRTEDLYVIVRDATQGTEARTREEYASDLARALGWGEPKHEKAKAGSVQNGH